MMGHVVIIPPSLKTLSCWVMSHDVSYGIPLAMRF